MISDITIHYFRKLSVVKYALLLCVFIMPSVHAQTNKLIKEGNDLYQKHQYKEATNEYLKALNKDPNNASGLFNLGNSLYQQNQFDSSRRFLAATEKVVKDKNGKAAADYNIGNTYMAQKKWDEAANAYKQTLRNNPNDVDAKYNLAYANEMKKKQEQEQKKQQQQNQQNKDDKKDKKDDKKGDKKDEKKDDNKDQKDQKDEEKGDKQKDDKQQQQPGKLSKEDADNMLNALQQQEKKLQDKLKKEKGASTRFAKDW